MSSSPQQVPRLDCLGVKRDRFGEQVNRPVEVLHNVFYHSCVEQQADAVPATRVFDVRKTDAPDLSRLSDVSRASKNLHVVGDNAEVLVLTEVNSFAQQRQ